RLFEDTKEIRARFLQSVGGGSYGTLVRKVLHEDGVSGPILLLGAGALAQSVAPFLLGEGVELWIANRTAEKAEALRAALLARADGASAAVRVVEERLGMRDASHVVICVPVDAAADLSRAEAYQGQTLLHLGGMRQECAPFADVEGFRALDDLFEIQKRQGQARSLQLASAARACEERAKLRALGNSVSIAHGWEDLAIFAS
ncbi:MAG: NAD(P)-binding domain-containing protein, partial [Bdellovibrionota bacterium]